MAQVTADSDELKRFASELQRFNQQLDDSTKRLQGHFSRLGDTWRDPQYQKFASEFTQTMTLLRQFRRSAEQQIPRLQARAEHLERFQNS